MRNLKNIPHTIITLLLLPIPQRLMKVDAIILVVCDESPGLVSYFLTICSLLLVLVTLPFSLLYTVKVVQVIHNQVPLPSRSRNFLCACYGCWSETKIKSQYPGLIIQRLN